MKNQKRNFGTALLLMAMAVQTQAAADVDAADYFTNRPFGWATCSNVAGKAYVVDGGARSELPKTIVLYSSGGDDRSAIQKAISQNDIIILDGSKGDFTVSKSISLYNLKNKTIVASKQSSALHFAERSFYWVRAYGCRAFGCRFQWPGLLETGE